MKLKLGNNYSAIGYSGLTDGKEVKGRLTEYFKPHDHAIIVCEETRIPCAVKYNTLKPLKNGN